jgi:NADH-quinone oxidoreductase subunit C
VDSTRLADRLRTRERFPGVQLARGEVTLVADRAEVKEVLRRLKDDPDLRFDALSDVSATDWPGRDPRFWVAYHLFSMGHRHRLRVKVGLAEEDPVIATVTDLFPTANWLEREVYDFFGIRFEGHPGLRRILMPDDWEGHPLRKDYALGGVGTRYKGAFIPSVERRSQ